jgi:hypothetical protein
MKDCTGVHMSKTSETITEFDLSDYQISKLIFQKELSA